MLRDGKTDISRVIFKDRRVMIYTFSHKAVAMLGFGRGYDDYRTFRTTTLKCTGLWHPASG
jgi:hypothetical protein